MKYELLEDHTIRLSEVLIKKGVYSYEDLKERHTKQNESLEFCLRYTKLGSKLKVYEEPKPKKKK